MRFLKLKSAFVFIAILMFSCKVANEQPNKEVIQNKEMKSKTASELLGNPEYLAISYGGYRLKSRDQNDQPTIDQLKMDMRLLDAMGIHMLRTYNVQLAHAGNVLEAIHQIKQENPNFEMYVMLGAWIDCLNAWTGMEPNHDVESPDNANEIARAVALAKKYPDIVKVIAVGNEAMVKWATAYYVQPSVILKWVNHLQELKKEGELSPDLWVTSSDNFASWGGGEDQYHVEDLNQLIHAVDYISMHTYPMHDTHYNPQFWGVKTEERGLSKEKMIQAAMLRSKEYCVAQYNSVKAYMAKQGADKPIHIGETGWASYSKGMYGAEGSKANDEYKEALFHDHMREWTESEGMSCFYFEAFDEPWKDAANPDGSENYFGLFTVEGKAKYVLWDAVDKGIFEGLGRYGNPVVKTFHGNKAAMMETVLVPPVKDSIYVPTFKQ